MYKQTLQNELIRVSYVEGNRDYIIMEDLKDVWNETTLFTQNIRGIGKAWQFIEHLFNQEDLKDGLSFSEIREVLDNKFNLKTHQYCAID